jgi:hypothetical protein
MDLNIIMDWTVILIATSGVVVYLWLRNRKRTKRTLAPLKEFAAEYNTEIADYDAWENTLIGLGTGEPKTLFFIRITPDGETREAIKLAEVSGCRMIKPERRVSYNKEYLNVVDRITLNITFQDHRPELVLEFYNNDYDSLTLTGELQLAQKWAEVIGIQLKAGLNWKVPSNKKTKSPAQKLPVTRPAAKVSVYPKTRKLKRPLEKAHPV